MEVLIINKMTGDYQITGIKINQTMCGRDAYWEEGLAVRNITIPWTCNVFHKVAHTSMSRL